MISPDKYKAISKQAQASRKARIEQHLNKVLEGSAEGNKNEPIKVPMFIEADWGWKDHFNPEEIFFCRELLRDWGWFLYDGHLRPDFSKQDTFLKVYFEEPPPPKPYVHIPWYKRVFTGASK